MTIMATRLIILLLATSSSQAPLETEGQSQKEFNSLSLSYQANKEMFRFGRFRFELTTASADSNESALAGRFARAYTAQGLYIFDGKNSRYELNYALEDVAKTTHKISENQSRQSLIPIRMLCDGEATLVDRQSANDLGSAFVSKAMIRPGTLPFSSSFNFPLELGQDSIDTSDLKGVLKPLIEGKCSVKEIDFHSRFGDSEVCKIVLDFGTGERTYWVDVNRGAIPLRIEDSQKSKVTHITIHENLQFVAAQGWLPLTERYVMQNGKIARQICITEVDVRKKPDLSAFRLDFPAPIKMYDDARKLRYSPQKAWSLLHLPSRNSSDTKPLVPKSFVAPPEMPREVKPGSALSISFFTIAVVLVAIVSVRIFVRRRMGGRSLPWRGV